MAEVPDMELPVDPAEELPADLATPDVPVSAYETWKADPNPATLHGVVESMAPKINFHLHRYGLGADPLAAGQARLFAAKAVQSYNPDAGTSLATWLDRSLIQLSRFKRTRATAMKVPERMQLDSYALQRATTDFEEEHGREPNLEELADRSGLSMKRINDVRGGFRKMTSEAPFEGNLAGNVEPDYLTEALEVTWREGDKIDRQILEMKTGFGGKYQPMAPKDIAIQLGLSPVALSRRSARLGAKIEDIVESLER